MEESQTIPLSLNNYIWLSEDSTTDGVVWDAKLNTQSQLNKLSGNVSFRDQPFCQSLSTEHL